MTVTREKGSIAQAPRFRDAWKHMAMFIIVWPIQVFVRKARPVFAMLYTLFPAVTPMNRIGMGFVAVLNG